MSNLTTLTHAHLLRLIALYPTVVQRVYKAKTKNDSKKLSQALEDDAWRYGGLVELVESRRSSSGSAGGWMEKAELERLVRWKITHGTNRPFLPAQVRKNEPSAVKSATLAGFKIHNKAVTSAPPPPQGVTDLQFPTEALNSLSTLTGVGPATATLLLSVHDPANVPFFQDEMYHWLCGGDGAATATKLKYNMKEYRALFDKVVELRQKLAKEAGASVRADELEKAGFVIGHLDVLSDEEKKSLEEATAMEKATGPKVIEAEKVALEGKEKGATKEGLGTKKQETGGKRKKHAAEEEQEGKKTEPETKRKRKSAGHVEAPAVEAPAKPRKSGRSR